MRRTYLTYTHVHNYSAYTYLMNSQLCFIMILNGFNISCSLGKYSNNVFYGFSSVKCSSSGILPVSRREQNEVDD